MLRRKCFEKIVRQFQGNSVVDDNKLFRESSAVDTFYRIKGINEQTGKDVTFFVDPLHILLNQERLSRLGFDGVDNYVKSLFNQGNTQLAELRKQCSDEDLLATIKSRHLQSPSELLAWTRYMSDNIKEFNAQVKQTLDKIKADDAANQVKADAAANQVQQSTAAAE